MPQLEKAREGDEKLLKKKKKERKKKEIKGKTDRTPSWKEYI